MTPNVTYELSPDNVENYTKNDIKETDQPQFICDICGKMYKYRNSLEIHIGIHNGISPYVCEICGKTFTQKIGLKKHQPIHTQIPQYSCHICSKTFIHEKTYKSHLAKHTGTKKIQCSICQLGCDTNTQLKRHFRTHTKEKPFPCDICGKFFAQKYNMYAHKRQIHEGNEDSSKSSSRRQCPLCGMSYERNKLAEHLSAHHAVNKSLIS